MEYMNNKLMRGMVHSALALSMAFVSHSSWAGPLNTAPTDIEFGIPVVIEPGNDLIEVNGPGDFGTEFVAVNNWYTHNIDVSSVFANGFNLYGTNYNAATQFKMNQHGNVSFETVEGLLLVHPDSTQVGQDLWARIAPVFAVHTGIACNFTQACNPGVLSAGGNSTGSNKVYYHLDPVKNVVTLTYDDRITKSSNYGWPMHPTDTTPFAGQMRFHDIGNGNFVVEYRYENTGWTTGLLAGWSNDDNINFVSLDKNTNYSTSSNINHPGVFAWMFVDGQYISVYNSNKLLEASENGKKVSSLATIDADNNESFTYSLLDDADGRFALVVESGVTFVVVADGGNRLDFDDNATHDIRVKVTDSADNTFEKTLTINLVERPTFEMSSDIRVPVDTAMDITIKTNVDQGSGIPTITATGLPDWMNFSDNGDGTVTLSGFPSFELTFHVTLTVTDGFGTETVRTFNITVTPEPVAPEISSVGGTPPTTTTVEVTVEGEDGDAASFGWMLMLLAGGLVARRKMK
jgi:hypothetical protein